MRNNQLIFDIGFHKGEDTRYYLHKGYHVVGVDADKELINNGEQCFQNEIHSGQLTLLNYAISSERNSSTPFYISHNKLWNSTHKGIAEREGIQARQEMVPSETLSVLMDIYGVPYYCKIDIEGNDIVALNSLRNNKELPLYISVETECLDDNSEAFNNTFETLDALKDLGYKRFKLVDQATLKVLDGEPFYSKPFDAEKFLDNFIYARFLLNKEDTLFSNIYPCTSGPFGEDLMGEWCDYETAKQFISFYSHEQRKLNTPVWHFWCDWHATI